MSRNQLLFTLKWKKQIVGSPMSKYFAELSYLVVLLMKIAVRYQIQ
jgi:hypothetical protein